MPTLLPQIFFKYFLISIISDRVTFVSFHVRARRKDRQALAAARAIGLRSFGSVFFMVVEFLVLLSEVTMYITSLSFCLKV